MKNILKKMKALAVAGITLGLAFGAQAEETVANVQYVDADGTVKVCPEATLVTESASEATTWNAGWYVVNADVTIDSSVICTGAVKLILCDGVTLTVNGGGNNAGIETDPNGSFTIYGQKGGTGALTVEANCAVAAAIGGGEGGAGSNITINGGMVTATCGDYAYGAAIGGGFGGAGTNITINGGTVTATRGGGACGAAIGGGKGGAGSDITINGGTVNATARGEGVDGAAIGGGEYGAGSNITINGGTVTATCGGYGFGAAIGGGENRAGSNITINGGTVTATCGEDAYGAAIGGGGYGAGSNITINGGTVEATCGEYARGAAIGGGESRAGSNITINGGTVTASCGDSAYSAAIGGGMVGAGSNITINGGTVEASCGNGALGAAIGGGDGGAASNIFVADSILIMADNNNPPTTVIEHASITTDISGALADKRYATAAVEARVALSKVEIVDSTGATIATATVSVNGKKVTQNDDGSYSVPANEPIKIVYTASENWIFGYCLTQKTLTLEGGISEDHALTDVEKASVIVAVAPDWVEGSTGRKIDIDTREKIVVSTPEAVLPIAYSTNNWGEVENAVKVRVDLGNRVLVALTTENGYKEWMPDEGAYGEYQLKQHWTDGSKGIASTNATIYYLAPQAPNQIVADDFEAIADAGSYSVDPETGLATFKVNGVEYTEGVNAFRSLRAANEAGVLVSVTNLTIQGMQLIDFDMKIDNPWALTIAPGAILTIGTDKNANLYASVTNNLQGIEGIDEGVGTIVLGKDADAETQVVQGALEKLRRDANVEIRPATNTPQKTEDGDIYAVVTNETTVSEEEGAVILPQMENHTGNIVIAIDENTTNDTLVAGKVVAENGTVAVVNEAETSLSVIGGITAKDVVVDNYGHFESDVTATTITITNRSTNTIVGTIKGKSIDMTGINFAAISNVTLEADKIVLSGLNELTGPLMLVSDDITNEGNFSWNVKGGNKTPYLNDFSVLPRAGIYYRISADVGQEVGTYVLASNATSAVNVIFDLDRNDGGKFLVANGETVSPGDGREYALTVDTLGRLVLKVESSVMLTIEAASFVKEYDGQLLELDDYDITSGTLLAGDELYVTAEGEIIDVGEVENVITSHKILRDGVDVTDQYNITVYPGLLKVTKVAKPLVVKANPMRVSDGEVNGFSLVEGVLAAGDEIVAEVVKTNDNDVVVCRIVSCAVMRGTTDVTANYTVMTEDSSVATNPNAEITVISKSKEIPNVASGKEVALGSEENPAVLDFQMKNGKFLVGANATYALVGEMWNASSIKIAPGKKVKIDGVSVQTNTFADLGVVQGTSTLAAGSFTEVSLSYLSGTKKSDRITIGSKSAFVAGDIDLGAGADRLSIGTESRFESGELRDIETVAFASRSTNEIGNVIGIQKLTVASGKAATKKAAAIPTKLVAGDMEMLTNKANTVSLGSNTESELGDILMGVKNDKLTLGDNSTAHFGCVDFGGGKDTFTVGKASTVVVVADEVGCESLTKFTIGNAAVAYLSNELIAKGKKLNGPAVFGKGATVVDIGPADIALNFTTLEEERADDVEESAQPLSGDVDGWLSDATHADGMALDADDYFVVEQNMTIKVSKDDDAKITLSINGRSPYYPFVRNHRVHEGDIIRIHKEKGGSAAGYAILRVK